MPRRDWLTSKRSPISSGVSACCIRCRRVPVRDGREIELQLALGLCLFTAKGAVEAKPPYMRALELAESSGEPQQRFEALYGVWQSTNDVRWNSRRQPALREIAEDGRTGGR